jgi:hypothetical protein
LELLQAIDFIRPEEGVAMETYQEICAQYDRYDDGIVVDCATMVRMWSTLDRSLASFNRKCGMITLKPSQDRPDDPKKK